MAFRDKFIEMLQHCAKTKQTPTSWEVGCYANADMLKNAEFGDYRSCLSASNPWHFMGLPVLERIDLPEDRVALIAGKNTAGTFNLKEPS